MISTNIITIAITILALCIYRCSNIGGEECYDEYELHVSAKDYCFAREDNVIGMCVIQLNDVTKQSNSAHWSSLGKHITVDSIGWTILRILSRRTNDEIAKEFVKLKSECHSQKE
jgi:protein unc-13